MVPHTWGTGEKQRIVMTVAMIHGSNSMGEGCVNAEGLTENLVLCYTNTDEYKVMKLHPEDEGRRNFKRIIWTTKELGF